MKHRAMRLKIRSMVGLLPLFATLSVEADTVRRFPAFVQRVRDFAARHPQAFA